MLKRRQFLPKPNFQYRLTFAFMILIGFAANLVGLMTLTLVTTDLDQRIGQAVQTHNQLDGIGPVIGEVVKPMIPKVLFAEAAILSLVFFLSIWFTHKIAGPLYRLERIAEQIGTGDLTVNVALRPDDELKELAEAMKSMNGSLIDRVRRLQKALDEAEPTPSPDSRLAGMRSVLAEFKLPEPAAAAPPPAPAPAAPTA